MKKLLLLFAFIACTLGMNAQSSVLKTSPGALAFGSFNACYEKLIAEKSSVQVSASAFFSGLKDANGDTVSAFGVGLGYRYYITKKEAPRGFYAMPNASFSFGSGSNRIGLGVDLGYQWIWDSGFALDIGLGPTYLIAAEDSIFSNGIVPSIVLAIGYAF